LVSPPSSRRPPYGGARAHLRDHDATNPASITPLALEVPLPAYRDEPSIEIEWDPSPPPRRRRTGLVAGALSVAVAILCAAIVRHGVRADAGSPRVIVAAPVTASAAAAAAADPLRPGSVVPAPVVPAPIVTAASATAPPSRAPIAFSSSASSAAASAAESSPAPVPTTSIAALPPAEKHALRATTQSADVPVVDVTALPRPQTGTIIGARNHRLYVDGALVRESTALVRCGVHSVKVGSAGKTQSVDVPCGGEITVR
jgi:hypothetical protein